MLKQPISIEILIVILLVHELIMTCTTVHTLL